MWTMKKHQNTHRRPSPKHTREEYLEVRLTIEEKQAFKEAAELAGIGLSTWVRERLRRLARQELGDGAAFLQKHSQKGVRS